MYIRATKTKIKGKEYVVHRLVEAYRNENGQPRQRVIMHLGTIDVPKERWKELAWLLEQRVLGRITFTSLSSELEAAADDLFARGTFAMSVPTAREQLEQTRDLVKVDLSSVSTSESRSLGPELVAAEMWNRLGLEQLLGGLGLRPKQIAVAKALVIGKLVKPSSELATWSWFNSQTALSEMTAVDIAGLGKDAFYETADLLYARRREIEAALYERETTLFSLERRLFLFDLTNTYFEGNAKQNTVAKYGRSKEKRRDCPLVSLALMVDAMGFTVYSQIYDGNQSEPRSLGDVLDELSRLPDHGGDKPVIVMDRGIATAGNVELLQARGYSYAVIERAPVEKQYLDEYTQLRTLLDGGCTTDLQPAGWSAVRPGVYVRKVQQSDVAHVLSFSISKQEKELAMDSQREQRFLADLARLRRSVEAGNIVVPAKISERVGRLKQKYPGIGHCYQVDVAVSDGEKRATSLRWTKLRPGEERPLSAGCYVIETSLVHMTAEEIWNDYMTLTRVEAAFRDLKSELGLRPVYHQKASRTRSHLFIGVLAYHLLVGIENILRQHGDHREWKTIREVLSTHHRTTVNLVGAERQIYHVRVSGTPESCHQSIYRCLGVVDRLKRKKSITNVESSD